MSSCHYSRRGPFDPKTSVQQYEVHIPEDHPAGTFWYHAHKHGSTAAAGFERSGRGADHRS